MALSAIHRAIILKEGCFSLSLPQEQTMRQVLFFIPLHLINNDWQDLPLCGYGFMLFLAFVLCTWLAARLARREGIPPESIQDLAIWLFVAGIVGARITFMIQYWDTMKADWFFAFFRIWEGG